MCASDAEVTHDPECSGREAEAPVQGRLQGPPRRSHSMALKPWLVCRLLSERKRLVPWGVSHPCVSLRYTPARQPRETVSVSRLGWFQAF